MCFTKDPRMPRTSTLMDRFYFPASHRHIPIV
uniref:Uncharacterized protein n=1 Tax=Anopheles atroparvus TaxID=41427 RepID=A0AAG5DH11_ANOAO